MFQTLVGGMAHVSAGVCVVVVGGAVGYLWPSMTHHGLNQTQASLNALHQKRSNFQEFLLSPFQNENHFTGTVWPPSCLFSSLFLFFFYEAANGKLFLDGLFYCLLVLTLIDLMLCFIWSVLTKTLNQLAIWMTKRWSTLLRHISERHSAFHLLCGILVQVLAVFETWSLCNVRGHN